ncbi:hypothetical protein Nepgr_001130 [Nepenthes gracilis]|uniref:Uncharacterized protein n=1 Tax=Nepenthes gracilis TaxID=150966 RepID=A0AAD3P3W0_NEPGR|nr:hypothetical protein Nepgr_001130 [Nepenthes gracilis]
MDKRSNRTDLLAAGRKKLQQFRQKKDNRGKDGRGKDGNDSSKPTSEVDKSDQDCHDADAASDAYKTKAELSQISEGGVELLLDSSLSVSASEENCIESAFDANVVDPLSVPISDVGKGAAVFPGDVELPVADAVAVDAFHKVDFLNANIPEADDLKVKGEPEASVNSANVASGGVDVEGLDKEDQVSNIGAMQEVHILGSNHHDRSVELDLKGDGIPLVSVPSEGAESAAVSEDTPEMLIILDSKQNTLLHVSADATSEVDKDDETAEAFGSAKVMPGTAEILCEIPHEDVLAGSSYEKTDFIQSVSGDSGHYEKEGNQAISTVDERYGEQYLPDGSNSLKGESRLRLPETKFVNLFGEYTVASGAYESSSGLSELAEVLKGLPEDDFVFLIKSREAVDGAGIKIPRNCTADIPEAFQQQLYLANVSKDLFLLQILEQSKNFDDQHYQLVDEISMLNASLLDVQERNRSLDAELARCRSELQAAMHTKEELFDQFHSAKMEVKFSAAVDELEIKLAHCNDLLAVSQAENERQLKILSTVTEEKNKSEEVKEQFVDKNKKLSQELADCRNSVASLQSEIASLNVNIASVAGERRKLEKEKDFLLNESENLSVDLAGCKQSLAALQEENSKLIVALAMAMEEQKKHEEDRDIFVHERQGLSTEILGCQELLSAEHGKCLQLEDDLKEATSHLEQLTEENIFFDISLGICKAKLQDIDNRQSQLLSEAANVGNQFIGYHGAVDNDDQRIPIKQVGEIASSVLGKPVPEFLAEMPHSNELKWDGHDDSGIVMLKGHLKEAEKVLHELENAVEGMHSHSTFLSRSVAKTAAPGVLKLIQAFESKALVDNHELDRTASSGSLPHGDPYLSAEEQTGNLRAILEAISQDVEHTSFLRDEKDGHKVANVAFGKLEVQIKVLKDYSSILEFRNIELEVLYAALKQHICGIESKNIALETSHEALAVQEAGLRAENIGLHMKLRDYHSRVSDLEGQLYELHRSSCKMATEMCNRVETLQKEMSGNIFAVEGEWESSIARVFQMVEKLDATMGQPFTPSTNEDNISAMCSHISLSVSAACELIEDLTMRLETAFTEHEALSSSYSEMDKKFEALSRENKLAIDLLQKISYELFSVLNDSLGLNGENETQTHEDRLHDPLDVSHFEALIKQLCSLLGERVQLKELNNKFHLELLDRINITEELNKKSINPHAILKLVEDLTDVLGLQDTQPNLDEPVLLRLQSSVSLLVQKYKEADEDARLLREGTHSIMTELIDLQGLIEHLNFSNFQQQNEILILKESLNQAKDAFDAALGELQEKVTELEQSEQRVASIREKLSIAVAKGKGLIVQRDSLKQSLAETSNELERYSQELCMKDSRLHEVEEKLKAYSEAGERMEALESELSYIRNSATTLRESFLLKDSALQRIEEILEDLELPEHFHSKGIIEKVDWLAKLVTTNSMPLADWDQSNSVGGGSYSDAGFAIMDAWKEDGQSNMNPIEDLRRKYDELQTKFYGLAEQNAVLEQSLMERNNMLQRWEMVLERINIPPQLQSMEPEERIEWLEGVLSETDDHLSSLQHKIDHLENYCGLLSADLEESQRRVCGLESSLQEVFHEKEDLSGRLTDLISVHEKALEKVVQLECKTEKFQYEVDALQEKLVDKVLVEEEIQQVEGGIVRLQNLIINALPDSGLEMVFPDGSRIEHLEQLLKILIESYTRNSVESPGNETAYERMPEHGENLDELSTRDAADVDTLKHADADVDKLRARDMVVEEGQNAMDLRRELDGLMVEFVHLREQRDEYVEKCQLLAGELEASGRKKDELQELLNQEEQKSATLREKLNVAVRKGKSLVQQRDSLKQTIEEMTNEIDQLKTEMNIRENAVSEFQAKIANMSAIMEQDKASESKNLLLKSQLIDAEQRLQERENTLSMLLIKMGEIDIIDQLNVSDPEQKLEGIRRLCSDLQASVASSEKEMEKSKRAAELLLAELNEVQERNDGLQDELARAYDKISTLSWEMEVEKSAKLEVLSQMDILSEERRKQLAEFEELKSSLLELEKIIFEINNITADVFTKDVELFHNLNIAVDSVLEETESGMPLVAVSGRLDYENSRKKDFQPASSFWDSKMPDQSDEVVGNDTCNFIGHHLQKLTAEIGFFKERISSYSRSLQKEAEQLINGINNLQREVTSQKMSLQSMKSELMHLESTVREKDAENIIIRRSISLLFEACTSSIVVIESTKGQMVGNVLASGDVDVTLKSLALADGEISCSSQTFPSSEGYVKTLVDRLLFAVKDFVSIQAESLEDHHKELRTALSNLQRELQEKDVENNRICMELVSQIKEAEATATNYSRDLESSKNQVHDLQKRCKVMEEEQNSLKQRVIDLQQKEVISIELQDKVNLLTDMMATKEQEIEALMQALDEEENQMEGLRNKIGQLEEVMQKKNTDLQHVEASRAKAMKKLSVTVTKFDELHHMSEGLLSEIENLQSQLQDQDSEISFLRQEVTRCTNDVLLASKLTKERDSNEFQELLAWLDKMCSGVLMRDVHLGNNNNSHEYKERLQKDITSLISELEDLRVVAQSKDALLQAERNRIEELLRRKEALEASLHEKELHLSVRGAGDFGDSTSEIVEIEPVVNKWAVPMGFHCFSESGGTGSLEYEEDDKVHGFKSLTTSRFVPKFTRPVSDMVDGLWVSCDRALMRQPALRLGIIIYWALLHTLLATFVI